MGTAVQKGISKDIAVGVAITGIICAIPIVFLWMLFIPVCILYYRSKLGRMNGAFVPVISLVLVAAVKGGTSVSMLFFAELMLAGFILGELIEMDISVEMTVLYTCGTVLMTGMLILIFYGNVAGTNINTLISGNIAKEFEQAEKILNQEGLELSEEQIHLFSAILEKARQIIVPMIPYLPSLAISFTLLTVWITLLIAKPVLKNRGLFYPDFGSLNTWKVPDFLVWCVIGCGAALLLPNQALKVFAGNGLFTLMTVYFLGGIAIVSFYFEKKQFPPVIRFFIYTLIALHNLTQFAVILLGFFDMWVNFRRLKNENGGL
ncbi:MAG: DUF2232 domain-containing protein [Desulfobacteraceae bacterium]|nr:DUF2232 domain-containing protein [Desulfobacteraceae bacterium]